MLFKSVINKLNTLQNLIFRYINIFINIDKFTKYLIKL